jgi:hypothetical protein
MTLFSTKNLIHYAVAVGLIVVASYIGNRFKDTFTNTDQDEYELIRKYLLNDSPLYGYDKPKLWIHSKYEYNARKWKSFMSRSSTDLNQPYLHLTVKTLINHCGSDFNVCLIDDESFSRLIPGWDVNVSRLAEPKRSQFRELGMAELVYIYGGFVVPNSFVCLRNLMPLYQLGIGHENDMPFIAETVNRTANTVHQQRRSVFTADTDFFGAPKRCPVIKDYVDYLKKRNQNPHIFQEAEFKGESSYWCNVAIEKRKMNRISGTMIGVKSLKGRPILLEELMEEAPLDLSPVELFGIYIPADEILRRPKYEWFAVMPAEELLTTHLIIVKYLATAIVESVRINAKKITVIETSDQTAISI